METNEPLRSIIDELYDELGLPRPKVDTFVPMVVPTVTHNDLEPRKLANGKWGIGKTSRLRDAEDAMDARLAKAAPAEPMRGPVSMEVRFVFAPPKGMRPGEPKATKPDIDNLLKTLLDSMGRLGFFEVGDQQVCDLHATKGYGEHEGIYITATEVKR